MTNRLTWADVTIGQFEQIQSIAGMRKNALDKAIDILSVMTGIPSEDYLDMELTKVQQELKRIEGLTSKAPEPRFESDKYIINGETYKLTLSPERMTAGQFIDYQMTMETTPNDLAALCSIFLVPKGKKYGEGYDPLELRKVLKEHFPVIDGMGIGFFFLMAANALQTAILSSSIRKLKKELRKEKDPQRKQTISQAIEKAQEALAVMRSGMR